MLKVGITGNIGSGKSAVENILIKMGLKTLCADRISHALFDNDEKIRKEIFEIFKTNDRHEIGNIIFKNSEKKKDLENILHPEIKRIIDEEILKCKDNIVFVFVPLLFEAGYQNMFDKIILVSADENIRLNRIIKRNNYTREHALDRIKSQMREEEKINKCDFVLKNEGSFEELKEKIEEILRKIFYQG